MTDKRTVFLVSKAARQRAHALIDAAPDGWCAIIAEETRTQAQNRKLWALISDMRRQLPDMAQFSAEDTKLRFLDALGSELRFLPKLEGQGMFPVGHRSSTLTVEQFSALVELILEYGARRGVRWTGPRQEAAA